MNCMKKKKMYHARKEDKYLVRGIGTDGIDKAIKLIDEGSTFLSSLTQLQRNDLDCVFKQITRFGLAYVTKYS